MLLLVSGATKTVIKYKDSPYLGVLLTPGSRQTANSSYGLPYGADNACFTGLKPKQFMNMIRNLEGKNPLFVCCPDVIFDARVTLIKFKLWSRVLKKRGLPIALVAQDGLSQYKIPWSKLDCLFIGGTTEYKLSEEVRELVKEAKIRGKWVHMGRVNSRKRIRYAISIGCDSIDGSGFSRFPEVKIPKGLQWIEERMG